MFLVIWFIARLNNNLMGQLANLNSKKRILFYFDLVK